MSQKSTTSLLRRYRLHVYVLQVAMLRVLFLAFVQKQELMTALVPAPFPPYSFYAIWPFIPSPGPARSTAARMPRTSLSDSLRLAQPVFARYDLYPTL
ncbi:hypothetical protein DPMN_143988 [Dreissena polymorpha]|uniref:Uncharacterized protein n=1 Tax=Dreissena polymorpha TaxID=45954 RepID=A0A9D4JKJ2_DREPO|nr:hypothetical protein DPMN_143988 [Dreissena polymorpha]